MSEPMSSGEIEDVLSSIRRLVSEDLRPLASQPAAAAKTAPKAIAAQGGKPHLILGGADMASGKLLLTPAFRVVSNEADAAPERAMVATDAPPLVLGQTIIADEALPSKAGETVAQEDWLPESSTSREDEVWGEVREGRDDWHAPDEDADFVIDQATGAAPPSDVTRVVSEIGAAVAESAEDWEPEAGDGPMVEVSWQAPEWVEEAEIVDEGAKDVATALADAAEAAAVAEIVSRAAQAKEQATQTANKPKAKDQPEEVFAQDTRYFDEAVLRDLVRDLIREELSGALGERITRNVRKLVRTEINRAMTARDFD